MNSLRIVLDLAGFRWLADSESIKRTFFGSSPSASMNRLILQWSFI